MAHSIRTCLLSSTASSQVGYYGKTFLFNWKKKLITFHPTLPLFRNTDPPRTLPFKSREGRHSFLLFEPDLNINSIILV